MSVSDERVDQLIDAVHAWEARPSRMQQAQPSEILRTLSELAEALDGLRAAAREALDAEDEMDLLDREHEDSQERDYDFASQLACLNAAVAGRHRYADARTALRALVGGES